MGRWWWHTLLICFYFHQLKDIMEWTGQIITHNIIKMFNARSPQIDTYIQYNVNKKTSQSFQSFTVVLLLLFWVYCVCVCAYMHKLIPKAGLLNIYF